MRKRFLIVSARRVGTSLADISDVLGINASTVSRRYDAAKARINDEQMADVECVISEYRALN